jgi:phosphoserine phosphatase
VGTGVDSIRVPADRGIVGECAQTREIINVPDAYADPRFNPEVDRRTGYHTRCLLTVPLVGHDESLVGVLQLLNKRGGTFDKRDERIGEALGAQCAVALQRARWIEVLVVKERMDRELAVAREIQSGFLPRSMPELPGYDVAGTSVPAEETGGDTFDVIGIDGPRLVALVGDATGHGVGPALSATQVRAMLRIALRLGDDLDAALSHINDQLDEDLASNLFVTAFLGVVDPATHRVRYHSAGQSPILHFHAATGECTWSSSTAPPLGILSPLPLSDSVHVELAPGDILGVMTDGVFECADSAHVQFGERGVEALFRKHHAQQPLDTLVETIHRAVRDHREDAPADDDMTILLVRRRPE